MARLTGVAMVREGARAGGRCSVASRRTIQALSTREIGRVNRNRRVVGVKASRGAGGRRLVLEEMAEGEYGLRLLTRLTG